jgi:dienelactone hydrolase
MAPPLLDRLLGALDDVYFVLKNRVITKRHRLFKGGWGNDDAIRAVIARFVSRGEPAQIDPSWDKSWAKEARYRFRDGNFVSPLFSQFLETQCSLARFRLLSPPQPSTDVVVMMPTTRETLYQQREALAAKLADEGIATFLLESPFTGRRKPTYQRTPMLTYFSDFFLQCGTAIEEARSVICWLRAQGFKRVGIAGVSHGGYLAAVAGAFAEPPLGVVTCVAPHSGNAVFIEGLTRKLCDWPGSAADGESVLSRARSLFDATSLEQIAELSAGHRLIAVAATHDKFVPSQSYRVMARHWRRSEVRWVRGGHVSSIMRHKVYLEAIKDALRPIHPLNV